MTKKLFSFAHSVQDKYAHGYGLVDEAPGKDLLKYKVKGLDEDGDAEVAVIYSKNEEEAIQAFIDIHPNKDFVDISIESAQDLLKE
jgi:hypothetical protein